MDAFPLLRVRACDVRPDLAARVREEPAARRQGYGAGLVGGTTVYAYLSRPLLGAWGLDWLARGTAELRLLQPVYEGEELTIRTGVVARSGGEVAGELVAEATALTARGPAATLLAGRAWGGPPLAPDPGAYPVAPLPAQAPAASEVTLAALDRLGSPELRVDQREVARYAAAVEDRLPIYRGREAVAHPGLLLQQADRALAESVALDAWLHVASDVVHCGLARVGERVTTRGGVARLFEEEGRRFVELDLLLVGGGGRPVMLVRHTAMWRPGSREPAPRS